ncbi:MAG TPA: DUF6526 family protein [Bryobacteraceae bacterium]|jgi:hypothetical protein|nr:DUF6526 family protein [Bryobacteraceae bacterium]
MEEQSYAKHARVVPLFHGVLFALIVLTFLGSLWNFYKHMFVSGQRTTDGLLVMVAVALILLFFFCRIFPLKAQDRAIRAEENLRHFALTGKLLDARLKMPQIIGLRFASDDEFVALARKAADEGLSMADIKKSVKNWRADTYRV